MQVRVLFFGVLKDLAGKAMDSISLPENATLGDVLRHYEQAIPQLKDSASSLAMSVNQEYAGPATRLSPGDEVALLPPVSGGSADGVGKPGEEKRRPRAAIVREAIETAAILKSVKRPEDGAAAVFEGIVRNHTRGRRTLYLEYEAYEEMALKQMEDLASAGVGGLQDSRRRHRPSPGTPRNRRNQRTDRGRFGPPGGGLRGLPLAHRYSQTHRAYLEKGAFRRWRGLGRRRALSG